DRMKEYQYLFDVVMYKLKLALATSVGQTLLMDLAQIPVSKGFDLHRWLYFLKQKIAFIDSSEGNYRPSAAFNQFQAMDLGAYNEIQAYIGLLQYIDDRLGELSGVTKERQGRLSTVETVGGIERGVVQSSYITEIWFSRHFETRKNALTSLINSAKYFVPTSESMKYATSDFGKIVFSLSENFIFADYSVFVGYDRRHVELLRSLKDLGMVALQAGVLSFGGLVEILGSEDVVRIKQVLKMEEERNQAMKAQAQQMDLQAKAAETQAKMAMEQMKAQTDLQIETMRSETQRSSDDVKAELQRWMYTMRNETETRKLDLQERVESEKAEIERRRLEMEERHREIEREMERFRLELERMKLQIEIQSLRDERKD
ncbi:MAG: hypothetical protein RMM53_12645, partial [Bacteroidia bacterium]|nr:hypothetical protein [Bacteroidia bacterium]